MTEIKIPHEYLPALRRMREGSIVPADLHKVDEFIAAAEADQPPLPEGWVVYTDSTGARRVVWNEAGHVSLWAGVSLADGAGDLDFLPRDRLAPLRPTVTEADVEKAARAARAAYFDGADTWDATHPDMRDAWMETVRAALDALGIEVTS